MTFEPAFKANAKWLKAFIKMLDAPQPFIGEIMEDKITIHSKGFMYWPSIDVRLINDNPGTKIHIFYNSFWSYLVLYIGLLSFFLSTGFGGSSPFLSKLENNLVLIAVFIGLAIYARWMQKRTVCFLTMSNRDN